MEVFEELASGKSIKKDLGDAFFKSMQNMTITIKPRHTTMKMVDGKTLVDNEFLPLILGRTSPLIDVETNKQKQQMIRRLKVGKR